MSVSYTHLIILTGIPGIFHSIVSYSRFRIFFGMSIYCQIFTPVSYTHLSEDGTQLLKNFVVNICGGKQDWSAASFIETTVAELKAQLGNDKDVYKRQLPMLDKFTL